MRGRAGGGAAINRVGRAGSGSKSSRRHKASRCRSRSAGDRSQSWKAKGAGHVASLFGRLVGRAGRDRGRERQAARLETRDLPQLRDTAARRRDDRINPL